MLYLNESVDEGFISLNIIESLCCENYTIIEESNDGFENDEFLHPHKMTQIYKTILQEHGQNEFGAETAIFIKHADVVCLDVAFIYSYSYLTNTLWQTVCKEKTLEFMKPYFNDSGCIKQEDANFVNLLLNVPTIRQITHARNKEESRMLDLIIDKSNTQ